MEIQRVWAAYFSPTGTTEKIVTHIAEHLAKPIEHPVLYFDFTLPPARQEAKRFLKSDLVVFGVPVYAGRVPNVLLKYLNTLEGNGAQAVPVVLFGNRNYDEALKELRNLLELQPKEWSCDKAAAMVTARSTSNWESTLTIGKGSAAGIAVDDCVVDEYWNLVGVVAEVGENWATVRTLVDSDTEMGGQLARTGGAAILEGDFALMGEGRLKLTYLPENSELIAGDLVTTSGRGGVYPAGLVAGHVEEVRTDASGMTRYAVIAPETDLDGLQQVFVITDFTVNE